MVGTVLHVFWNYLFIIYLDWGIEGIGYTASITFCIELIGNIIITHFQKDLKESLDVSFFNPDVFINVYEYIRLGIPGTSIMLLDWGSYEILAIFSGFIGVKNQAVQIIMLNIMLFMFNIPFGFQIAACSVIGQLIGANNLVQAQRAESFIFKFSAFICLCIFILLSFF